MAVALVFVVAGALLVNGSLEQGVGWTTDGPESGYFPLRIGWLIVAVGVIQAAIAVAMARRDRRQPSTREIALRRDRIKPLLQVFLPMVVYRRCDTVARPVHRLGTVCRGLHVVARRIQLAGACPPAWRSAPSSTCCSRRGSRSSCYKGPIIEWVVEATRR